jgi:Protein of unknown function (DUF2934)
MARAKSSENGSSRARKSKTAKTTPHNGSHPATDMQEQIRARAYQLYEQRAGSPGSEQDDWATAEREVLARHAGQGN